MEDDAARLGIYLPTIEYIFSFAHSLYSRLFFAYQALDHDHYYCADYELCFRMLTKEVLFLAA
jgi:hypothetical protein